MEDHEKALLEKLKAISQSDAQDSRALKSFLITMDDIIGIHSIRVSGYACMSGRELGLSEEDLAALRTSALLHDIGKILIPPVILNKADGLSQAEMSTIRRHPVTGVKILRDIDRYKTFADTVHHHHEFFNGRGYPCGLSGSDIPLLSRIIAAADSYEAMTSERPYRKGFSHREAITRLKMGRSTQFDPEIIDSFICALKKFSGEDFWGTGINLEL